MDSNDLDNGSAIMCGGEPTDHKCNEDAVCYETNEGRFFFKNKEEADEWFNNNYKDVSSGSVACSICGRAAIDNAMWL
jgi:hypothetical protein